MRGEREGSFDCAARERSLALRAREAAARARALAAEFAAPQRPG
jgi:hypothetical protein